MKLTGHKTRSVLERHNIASDSDRGDAAVRLNGIPLSESGVSRQATRTAPRSCSRPDRHTRRIATNHLDDAFDASPALVDSGIYLRGRAFLCAIAAQ